MYKKIIVVLTLLVSLMFGLFCFTVVEFANMQMDIPTIRQQIESEIIKPTKEVEVKKEPEIYNAALTAVGDLMVHEWQLSGAYNKATNSYDFTEAFEMVKPILQKADITIGNLETTFGSEQKGYAYYPTFNTPDTFANALKDAGFDILTTANNHCMDTRNFGLQRTIDILDNLNIKHVGTYKSQAERDTINIIQVNNIKFAFLSYTYGTNGIPIPSDKPYSVNLVDIELIKQDIEMAKQKEADIIIVLPHFGSEYQLLPNKSQTQLVDMMFEAGADIILGSHPHVLQPMEKRIIQNPDGTTRTGFVIYSLGNFLSSQTTEPRDSSIILNLEFEKIENGKTELKSVNFIPTWVQFRKINGKYCVRALPIYQTLNNADEIDLTQSEIAKMKKSINTTLKSMYRNNYVEQDLKEIYYFE